LKEATLLWLHLSNLTDLGFEAVIMAGVVQVMIIEF